MNGLNDNSIEARIASRLWPGLLMAWLWLPSPLPAESEFDVPDEEWLFSDWEEQAAEVNEGALQLLPQPPTEPVHRHINRIAISAESLRSGWVTLHQCHENLDAVPALQIQYRRGRTRSLEISEIRHIEKAWVEGDSVQLQNVGRGSRLCLRLQTRALHRRDDHYVLLTGPYMRRFLDGYYPMYVSLQVSYPDDLLRYRSAEPVAFTRVDKGRIKRALWFEGKLVLRLRFDTRNQ